MSCLALPYILVFSEIRVKGLDFNSLYRYSEQLLINFSLATYLVGIVFYSLVCIVPATTYPNISEEVCAALSEYNHPLYSECAVLAHCRL